MTTSPRLLPVGPRAILAEFDSLAEVMAAASRLRRAGIDGLIDIVPAARTVLFTYEHGQAKQLAIDRLQLVDGRLDNSVVGVEAGDVASVEIEVVYDGVDLGEVAAACAMSIDAVVEAHSSADYTVAFCGFAPGFAYMVGIDERLIVPRLATPRTRVPAGSVAIASEFTAVYPQQGSGGWRLLGHTEAVMWDETRAQPALTPPGAHVRFVPR